jgi:hypothetical protein
MISKMTSETVEIVWPDSNFAQFGGHVLERLFHARTQLQSDAFREKRFTVRVTIEIDRTETVAANSYSNANDET